MRNWGSKLGPGHLEEPPGHSAPGTWHHQNRASFIAMGCDQNCLIGETFWPRFFHSDVNSTFGTSALLFAAVNSAKFRSKVFISSCYAAVRINMWSTNCPSANFWLATGTLLTVHWVWQNMAKRWTTKAKKEAGRMQPTHVYTLCSKNFLNHVPTLNHATLSPASSHLKADVPVLPHGGMGRAGRRLEVQRFYFIYAMIYFFSNGHRNGYPLSGWSLQCSNIKKTT